MLSVATNGATGELDAATLRDVVRGDRAAARVLVDLYQVRVFAMVSRMLAGRGRATIEDVAQDTFLAVFRRLPGFDPAGTARLSTWILTIAARRSIDELRRQRPTLLASGALESTGDGGAAWDRSTARPDDRARRRELGAAIEAAIAELSPELRAAFLMREYHGLEYTEIADALGIDLGTVKSRLSRARAALRERLAEVRHDG